VLGNHFATGELDRDGVFIATKVAHPNVAPPMYMDPDVSFNPAEVPDIRARIFKDYQQSLNDLGVGYVDLLLLHWPGAFGETDAKVARAKRAECWRALEELLASRRVRAIGVCNYTQKHLAELMEDTTIVPAVNQIEFHPYCQDHELIAFCQANHIVVEAYAPIGSGALHLPADPTIVRIAGEVGKTPGQVILRFATQQGIAVLPKSSKASRIAENQAIFDFDLSPDQLQAIKDLHKKGEEAKRTCPDPATIL
jgi:diketogulonate reductase-like aldo/keto reductase